MTVVEQCTYFLKMYLLGPISILDLIKYTFVYLFFLFCKFFTNFSQFCLNLQAFSLNFTNFNQNFSQIFPKLTFRVSHLVKLWKLSAYHKIIQNFVENGGRIFTQSPNYLHANFFQNNAKCTYFHPNMYLRWQKMYLVKNVLENQTWAVPLLLAWSYMVPLMSTWWKYEFSQIANNKQSPQIFPNSAFPFRLAKISIFSHMGEP